MTEEPLRTRVRLQKIFQVVCNKGKFIFVGEGFALKCMGCDFAENLTTVGEALVEWENDGTIVVHGKGFAEIGEGE